MEFDHILDSSRSNDIVWHVVWIIACVFNHIVGGNAGFVFDFLDIVYSQLACKELAAHNRNLEVGAFFFSEEHNIDGILWLISFFDHNTDSFKRSDAADKAVKPSSVLDGVNVRS